MAALGYGCVLCNNYLSQLKGEFEISDVWGLVTAIRTPRNFLDGYRDLSGPSMSPEETRLKNGSQTAAR